MAGTTRFAQVVLLGAWLLTGAPKPTVSVAAASNLSEVCAILGSQFEANTGIHPVFSFGSTALLTQQIENGAPFDVFLAADTEHPQKLESAGLLVPGSRSVYAVGVLAMWAPEGKADRMEDLLRPEVRTIALAKPELAPYGQAAVETLTKLELWERVKPKVVYGDNISMAKQYGSSGNADVVFTALSLVFSEKGKIIRVDESLHKPLRQELGVVAGSKNQAAARSFAAFLTGAGQKTLAANGYLLR